MLPPDLPVVLSRVVSPIAFCSISSTKELFLCLCSSPLTIDSDKRSFFLDRASEKKCFMISARELSIVWSENWSWVSNYPDSRFSEVAELLCFWQLEIQGAIETSELSPNTWYAAHFILKHNEQSSEFGQHPVELALVSVDDDGGTQVSKRETLIHPINHVVNMTERFSGYGHTTPRVPRSRESGGRPMEQSPPGDLGPRDDGWMDVEIGEFHVNGGEDGGEAEVSLTEVKAWAGA